MRAFLMVCGAAAALTACDQFPGLQRGAGDERSDDRLALALEVPDALDWGDVATIHMSVTNESNTAMRDLRLELYLPPWLEFTGVEPVGTEVALLSTGDETRLGYAVGEPPLAPGEARTIVQRVRVPPRAVGIGRTPGDTVIEPSLVPQNRTLRARLVAPDGRLVGTELRTTLTFRGVAPMAPSVPALPPADSPATVTPRDTPVVTPRDTPAVTPPPSVRDTVPAQ